MSLLQIYYGVHQLKKVENRLIFDEVMGKSLVSCFFHSQCSYMLNDVKADCLQLKLCCTGTGWLSLVDVFAISAMQCYKYVMRNSSANTSSSWRLWQLSHKIEAKTMHLVLRLEPNFKKLTLLYMIKANIHTALRCSREQEILQRCLNSHS